MDAVIANDLDPAPTPRGDWRGLIKDWRQDLLAGFLVFLIALPLCLGISIASGYPPIAGIFTAIIGGLIAPFVSNSELTIKGPAAGLISIAIGCIVDFGGNGDPTTAAGMEAYQRAMAVGVAAGMLQILIALFRSGILGEFFPTSAVHGMLAAIGVIIILKQIPVAMGVGNAGKSFDLIRTMPEKFAQMNPAIALIGAVSLLILFGLPWLKNRYVKMVPAQMIVLLVAIPLGLFLGLNEDQRYTFAGNEYEVGKRFLVLVPDNMFANLPFPDFSALAMSKGWYWVMMFTLIGSLETLLSAKAVDTLDPWRRKSNMDRDMLAVGIGNTLSAFVGGLPMISEIVRSRANIDNGARTRFANMFHGLFLLVFVATVPWLIRLIPLAALAAMLIFTGFRLASPRVFINVYKVGREQFVIFVTTVIATLATDLLVGIAIGIGVKFLIHIINGMPMKAMFLPAVSVDHVDVKTYLVRVRHSAVFSNWILLRRRIVGLPADSNVVLDLADTRLVDHTVMEKLHELELQFAQEHRKLSVVGLDKHRSVSAHPYAARLASSKYPASGSGGASAAATSIQAGMPNATSYVEDRGERGCQPPEV